jgi:hypothetical protein
LAVERAIEAVQPELVLGTQMERHIAKRHGIPCAVISAPFHVQDVPARHSPQMGWEGANVIFDTWVHPLMMGLEEHLLTMFREDFEFRDSSAPSHLHSAGHETELPQREAAAPGAVTAAPAPASDGAVQWSDSRSSCAVRCAATPRRSPRCRAWGRSRWTRCTKPRRTMASKAAATSVRVTIITLDAHLAGAFERARKALVAELPGLHFTMHVAAEFATDPSAIARATADIAAADFIVATQLFTEESAGAVRAAIDARGDTADAPAAQTLEVHSGRGAGCARVLPRVAVLAGGF